MQKAPPDRVGRKRTLDQDEQRQKQFEICPENNEQKAERLRLRATYAVGQSTNRIRIGTHKYDDQCKLEHSVDSQIRLKYGKYHPSSKATYFSCPSQALDQDQTDAEDERETYHPQISERISVVLKT